MDYGPDRPDAKIMSKAFNSKPGKFAIEALLGSINSLSGRKNDKDLNDYAKWHHLRLALDFDWITKMVGSDARILEVGGSPFFLTNALLTQGYKLDVIDKLSDTAGMTVTRCDIEQEKIPFDDNTFDEILFNEVFEHMRINPIFTMQEILRILRPNGRLWLSTPNLGSLRGITNLIMKNESWSVVPEGVYAQYELLSKIGHMGHVREYTSKEVTDFLLRVGFQVEKVIYRGTYGNRMANGMTKMLPRLKPYFTCIARKPNGERSK